MPEQRSDIYSGNYRLRLRSGCFYTDSQVATPLVTNTVSQHDIVCNDKVLEKVQVQVEDILILNK